MHYNTRIPKDLFCHLSCFILLVLLVCVLALQVDAVDGLYQIKRNGNSGYIDETGKYVIQPQLGDALNFSEGLAMARISSKYGYIDKTGKYVREPTE